jgi:hypothetical protein
MQYEDMTIKEFMEQLLGQMTPPIILHSNIDEIERPERTVQLSFSTDGVSQLKLATFPRWAGLTLDFIVTPGENTHIHLTEQELKKLIWSYLQFQEDIEEVKFQKIEDQLEQHRQLQVRADPLYLTIKEYGDHRYSIHYTPTYALQNQLENYRSNFGITATDIQERCDVLEEHLTSIHLESLREYEILPYDDLKRQAKNCNVELTTSREGVYQLLIPRDHSFAWVWSSEEEITLGQVAFRLRYMKGALPRLF